MTLNTEYVNIVADDESLKSSKTGSSFQGLDLVQEDGARSGNVVKYRLTSKSTATDYSKLIKDLKQNKQIKHILPFFSRGANAQPIGTSDIKAAGRRTESSDCKGGSLYAFVVYYVYS